MGSLANIRVTLRAIDRAAGVISPQKRIALEEFLQALLEDLQVDGAQSSWCFGFGILQLVAELCFIDCTNTEDNAAAHVAGHCMAQNLRDL